MAREEHDRENLLRDAVAMVERIAWRTPTGEELFIGFRQCGAASVYLDQDLVYHFNSAGELRRGYLDGELLKADQRQLRGMRRHRPGGEVQLRSRLLGAEETAALLTRIRRELTELADRIVAGELELLGSVPEKVDVAARAVDWLRDVASGAIAIARVPHAS